MSKKVKFPLLAKMAVWLLIHFAVLAVAFALFVNWQLSLGLDSVLSGAAGDRLKTLGSAVASDLKAASREDWPEIVDHHVEPYGLEAMLILSRGREVVGDGLQLPEDIEARLKDEDPERGRHPRPMRLPTEEGEGPGEDGDFLPPRGEGGLSEGGPGGGPPMLGPRGGGPPPGGGPRGGPPGDGPPRGRVKSEADPEVRPVFMNRSSDGGGYWAALDLPLFKPGVETPLHGILILRSSNASAGGLFFDLKPWQLGGLAVLFLSLLIWAPFIIGITRYVSRLSRATERIALGKFDTQIKDSRLDELGSLGNSIEEMSQKIDRLLRGQKRFLGDVAHELCSPLARIRTGLGVMEHGLDPAKKERLDSIEEDVVELSDLISEILAFTKASTAPDSVKLELIEILPILKQELERECPGHEVEWRVPQGTLIQADLRLFTRAVANVLRNAHRHAGDNCLLHIYAKKIDGDVELMIADNGPGVGPGVVSRLFEPFYRPDDARNREAGGAGLGMAIVHAAVDACGGSVSARRVDPHGLAIIFTLNTP